MEVFSKAIVCPPPTTFADGLTTASLGQPQLSTALEQHARYCEALRTAGLEVITLAPDPEFPDSTFVEDTAVLTPTWAVLTRPGAASRSGEIERMGRILSDHFDAHAKITSPGTLDGGDICEIGNHFLIGLSKRTNEDGAAQLSEILASKGYSSQLIDIRGMKDILHLKSGIAYLGEGQALVISSLADEIKVDNLSLHLVPTGEEYAANCIRVNELLFVAAGFPRTAELLISLDFQTVELEMSEFQKMDGGLSCLSLRF